MLDTSGDGGVNCLGQMGVMQMFFVLLCSVGRLKYKKNKKVDLTKISFLTDNYINALSPLVGAYNVT